MCKCLDVFILYVLVPIGPSQIDVHEYNSRIKGLVIEWYSLSNVNTRIEKYIVTWKAVHSDYVRSADQAPFSPRYHFYTSSHNSELLPGEIYEVTVESFSYEARSPLTSNNTKNGTLGKFRLRFFKEIFLDTMHYYVNFP